MSKRLSMKKGRAAYTDIAEGVGPTLRLSDVA